jgi:single-strand DNA-binding protein
MNICFVSGNIVADAEYKEVPVGGVHTPRCRFSVAVNEKKSNGEKIVNYFEVTLWRDYATKMAPWMKKGRKVNVFGNIRLNKYKTSNNEERAELQIANATVELTDKKPSEEVPATRVIAPTVIIPEELPF